MKLSEAMRLGSMLVPQGFGDLLDYKTDTREIIAACAAGAAHLAVGGLVDQDVCWEEPWPWVGVTRQPCPVPLCISCSEAVVGTLIPHLNDHHLWTRERVADWVETIEPTEVDADGRSREPSQAIAPAVSSEVALGLTGQRHV